MSAPRLWVNGLETAATDRGDGPPVVFLHGVPESRGGWDRIINALQRDYRCVAPDLPGFGDSPLPDESFDWSVMSWSAWADALLDVAGILEPAILVAHDVGAVPGCALAAAAPDRFRAVILTNTVIHEEYSWHPMARVWARPMLGQLLMLGLIRPAFVSSMKRDAPDLDRTEANRIYDRMTESTRQAILRWYQRMTKREYFGGLSRRFEEATKQLPTRVLWGRRDRYIPEEFAHRFGGQVELIDDAGHWLPLEKPQMVVTAVRRAKWGRRRR